MLKSIFSAHVTLWFDRWRRKIIGHPFHTTSILQDLCIVSKSTVIQMIYSPEMLNSCQNRPFIFRMPLKFDTWPSKTIGEILLRHVKLCASFLNHGWIKIGGTDRKCPNWGNHLVWPLWYWPLTSDLNLLYGHYVSQWGSLLKMPRLYDDRNIVKNGVMYRQTDGRTEPFIQLLCRS